jgi:hypothetical protein
LQSKRDASHGEASKLRANRSIRIVNHFVACGLGLSAPKRLRALEHCGGKAFNDIWRVRPFATAAESLVCWRFEDAIDFAF